MPAVIDKCRAEVAPALKVRRRGKRLTEIVVERLE